MTTAPLGTLLRHIQTMSVRHARERTDRQLLDDFASRHDESAFAALVGRHGAMVLRVCRRVLGHEQDAEDAFQATFLALARHTSAIRKREALADWLHGVAYRTAMKAKRGAARRRNHEARRRALTPEAVPSPRWDDVQAMLDEEVRALPAPFRAAFTLCVLEGKSGPQAAAELGCKAGTVSSRLTRARERLRRQLSRRGIRLAALLGALSVAESAGRAALPDALARSAVRFGLLVAAGGPAAAIPSRVAALAAGVTGAMWSSKLKVATAVLLAVGLVAGAIALARQALAAGEPPAESQKSQAGSRKPEPAAAKPAADEKDDDVEVSGRVVDPDGKAFAGARVFFARSVLVSRDSPPPPPTTTSDAEGRFRLRVSRTGYETDHEKGDWLRGAVVAIRKGFSFGWAGSDSAEKLVNVTVKLAGEVPIEGRVVDLQGKPVAGVSVRVLSVKFREDGDDLRGFVKELRSPQYAGGQYLPGFAGTVVDPALLALTPPAVTGADGKFRVTGISAECQVGLRFEGPTIETVEAYALTRPAPTIGLPHNLVFHGATFDHAAAPTRPIVGVVRDKDTGKPLAGVPVRARIPSTVGFTDKYVSTVTDADGRYRLVGLSQNGGHRLELLPAPGQPYLPAVKPLGTTTGLDPVTADFSLKRGVLIRGRVTDKATGRPVPAVVAYFVFADNPHLKESPEFRGSDLHGSVHAAEDGSFILVGLPGRGLLVAQAAGRLVDQYVMASGADAIDGPRLGQHFDTEPSLIDPHRFNTLAEVNPAKGAESVVGDLALDPGKTATGTVVDPDGKPVKGVRIEPVRGVGFRAGEMPSAGFRVPALDPKHPRWFFFRHPGKNLAAAVLLKGDEPKPVTVRLQKCATITGRVVDDDGLPRFAWILDGIESGQLDVHDYFAFGGSPMHGTGKDGRFRVEGVIPGLKVAVYAGKNTTYFDPLVTGLTLKPGEVKDLGDVRAKPSQ